MKNKKDVMYEIETTRMWYEGYIIGLIDQELPDGFHEKLELNIRKAIEDLTLEMVSIFHEFYSDGGEDAEQQNREGDNA